MKYETKARPITTVKELDAALKAKARIEFTACGCDYALPACTLPGSAGWISSNARIWMVGEFPSGNNRLRAFYPQRPSLLSRLAFWRAAA
jgi:hypothetical protein